MERMAEAAQVAVLRFAFLDVPNPRPAEWDPPSLQVLARKYGLSRSAADAAQRVARVEGWELELDAILARQWHASHGLGAWTERRFARRFAEMNYAHLLADGAAGKRLALAYGIEVWRRYENAVKAWEAFLELRTAKRAYWTRPGARSGRDVLLGAGIAA